MRTPGSGATAASTATSAGDARVAPAPGASSIPATALTVARSVAVLLGLERALEGHAEVRGLVVGQRREPHPEVVEVQPGDLLVEVLRQHVHTVLVGVGVREQLDLRQH